MTAARAPRLDPTHTPHAIPRLKRGSTLLLATHNAGKVSEFRELFTPLGIVLVSAGDKGLPEPVETGTTFVENARLKAHAAAAASGMIALADDSGLCVDALDGEPGVYTADWAASSNGRDYGMAMRRVEDRLQAIGANSPGLRKGSFNATLCLAHPDGRDDLYVGQVTGTMVWPPRGDKGFGFDPIFMPDGFDITFGEMPSSAKHSWAPGQIGLSHRARAFAKFVEGAIELS
ncbi:MAG: non-canonical purine NTP pyrophosphatase [Devosia sp.]